LTVFFLIPQNGTGRLLPFQKNIFQKNLKTKIMANTKWIMDASHSDLSFKVRHLMISTVKGNFQKFDATLETEGNGMATAKVHFTADVSSISTNNEQRDAHLRTGDFFDAENHPQLTFEGKKLEQVGDDYKLHGILTMRGVSKDVVLNVEYGGLVQDPWGNDRVGFTVSGKVNRKDYGVSFGMVSETGGALLGDEVTIGADVQFIKAAAAVEAGQATQKAA
jgi:polyisoprenoid-binding protein YceI